MDTRMTKRNFDQAETEPDASEEGRQNKSVIYQIVEAQITMLEEQREIYTKQEERFNRIIDKIEHKTSEIAKRQTSIEDTQELLQDALADVSDKIGEIEQRSRLWNSLDESSSEAHAKLFAEMHKDLRTELTSVLQCTIDDLKIKISAGRTQYEESIYKRLEKQSVGTARVVDQTMEHRIGQRKEIHFSDRPGTPNASSTPQLSVRRGVEPSTNAIRPVQKPTLYDGKIQWELYLAQFNIIAEMNGWRDYEKASFLASSLAGTALNVLSNLSSEKRQDFQSLVAALDGRYGTAHRTELARARV